MLSKEQICNIINKQFGCKCDKDICYCSVVTDLYNGQENIELLKENE